MKKIVILIGGFKNNRGSEAMVRGCIKNLRNSYKDCFIVLSSKDIQKGEVCNISGIDKYVNRFTYNRNNKLIRYSIGIIRYILKQKQLTNWINHYPLFQECKTADLVIVIGGDNYDKAYKAFPDMHSINKTLRKIVGGKLIFLNCSIHPDEINNKIIKDLKLFDKVTARECITYEALKATEINDRLDYFPDIAFSMNKAAVTLPEIFSTGNVVGINLSTLILQDKYTSQSDEIIKGYQKIVDYILDDLKYKVLLVPHVVDADIHVLRRLYDNFINDDRIYLLEDNKYNAEETKFIISNCCLYLGARTHSTIAAYSTCVPTLVLGYSIKSKGIAMDLFQDTQNYVVDVQNLVSGEELFESFKEFALRADNIKMQLNNIIPTYVEKTNAYANYFGNLLEG